MLNTPDAPLASSAARVRRPTAFITHLPAFAGLRSTRTHTSHRYIIETGRVGKLLRRSAGVGLSAVIISLLPPALHSLLHSFVAITLDTLPLTLSSPSFLPTAARSSSSPARRKKRAMINSTKYTRRERSPRPLEGSASKLRQTERARSRRLPPSVQRVATTTTAATTTVEYDVSPCHVVDFKFTEKLRRREKRGGRRAEEKVDYGRC